MSTTLTLTPKPGIAAVLIDVTAAPAGSLLISRYDNNGTGKVRLLPGQQPITGGLTVYDYEAAITGNVTYEILGDLGTVSATTSIDATQPQFAVAVLPTRRQAVTAVLDYDAASEFGGTIHRITDRPDPLVITSPLRFREGSLSVYAPTYADAQAVRDVAAPGEVILFRQADYPGMDMYLVAKSVSVKPRSDGTVIRRWEVSINYVEVKVPSGALMSSAAWNFNDIKGLGTFNAVHTQFATFRDLVAGP